MVTSWSLKYSNAALIILGAGPPCQGVSGLNADKRGALKDQRSKLFKEVPRIRDLVKRKFYWAQVQLIMESVASMDDKERKVMSSAVELTPWKVDAIGLRLCRRPRLYWVTWELQEQEGVCLEEADEDWDYGLVSLTSKVETQNFLEPGWKLAGDALPTFTTARPSEYPGRKPAGLEGLTQVEKSRWEHDFHRFPPYQYAQKCGLVNRKQEWRTPSVNERELCMGFPLNYTRMCVPKQEQKGWECENIRLSLLGNSWRVGVIVWMLGQLCHPLGLCPELCPQRVVEILTPGFSSRLQSLLLRPPLGASRAKVQQDPQGILVKKLLGIASIKGEDLLRQPSTEHSVKFHRLRASIPASLWKWKDLTGWAWKGSRTHKLFGDESRAYHFEVVDKEKACKFLQIVASG